MLNTLQFEAQNARVTKSLSNEGANSSLFTLYLAMQLTDPVLHGACELNTIEAESSYSSISTSSLAAERSPKSNLYSSESDYLVQRQFYTELQRSSEPSIHLKFLNAFMPQPLHYSAQAVLLTDDVVANLPLETQGFYKTVIAADHLAENAVTNAAKNAAENPININHMHNDGPIAEYSKTSNEYTSAPDELPQQAALDTFLQTIKQSRELDF